VLRGLRLLLGHIEEIIAGTFFVVIVTAVAVGVFFRYVLDNPIPWTNELATIAFVWVVFVGASAALKREMHIGIDVVTQLLPLNLRRVVAILVNLAILWILKSFIIDGLQFAIAAREAHPISASLHLDRSGGAGGWRLHGRRVIQSTWMRIQELRGRSVEPRESSTSAAESPAL